MKRLFSIFYDTSHSFEGQEDRERVLMLRRRHPVVIYMRLALFFVALILPLFALPAFGTNPVFLFVLGLWYLVFWLLIFYSLTMYSLNVMVITDRRVMDNDQHGLFDRKISELHISRIQDVSVHTKGVMPTFFKYGDIEVQTAAMEKQFIFREISRPEEAKDMIMKIVSARHDDVRVHV